MYITYIHYVHCVVVKKWLHQYNNRTGLSGSLDTLSEVLSFMCSIYLLQGKVFSSIQPQTNINDVCIYPNTGENNSTDNVMIHFGSVAAEHLINKLKKSYNY